MNGSALLRCSAITLASLLLSSNSAQAHKLDAIWKVDGKNIRVEAFFDDDTPAQDATVSVVAEGSGTMAEGKADDRGICILPTPTPGQYTLIVSCIGHAARKPMPIAASQNPQSSDPGPSRDELTRTPWSRVGIGLGVIAALYVLIHVVRRGRRPGTAAEYK